MSNYRRLISYIYAYEGGVKGKNIGFAKLEVRNDQCKLSVNVKKVYVGGNNMGVYLLAGKREVFLGNIFIRNGAGEFRAIVQSGNIENSGTTIDECYGLTVHEVENAWQSYTTIWEDAVARAAQVDLADVTSENQKEKDMTRENITTVPESVPQYADSAVAEIEREIEMNQRTDAADRRNRTPSAPAFCSAVPGTGRLSSPASSSGTGLCESSVETPVVLEGITSVPYNCNSEQGEIPPAGADYGTRSIEAIWQETMSQGTSYQEPAAQEDTYQEPRQESLDSEPVSEAGMPPESTPEEKANQEITSWESMPQDSARQESAVRESATQTVANRENTQQEAASPQTVAQESAGRITVAQETVTQGTEAQETVTQGTEVQETVTQGTEVQETVTQGTEAQETVTQEAASQKAGNREANQAVQTQPFNNGFLNRLASLAAERYKNRPIMEEMNRVTGRSNQEESVSQQEPENQNMEISQELQPETPPQITSRTPPHLYIGDPSELDALEQEEREESSHQQLWDYLRRIHTKMPAFDYEHGCEILTIKPQDIGLLPRETWVYGNNSFLLHGYYNYRYLILAKLYNPDGKPRYLLGIPGHYYSNEKYMASMFGFPNFVLAKQQPAEDGRFGFWYTDVQLGD